MKELVTVSIAGLLLSATLSGSSWQSQTTPQIRDSSKTDASHISALIADEVRHRLVMMPYYGVFDWLEGEVLPNGTVVLRGQVTRPDNKI